jgi:hypothetical protein
MQCRHYAGESLIAEWNQDPPAGNRLLIADTVRKNHVQRDRQGYVAENGHEQV